MMLNRTVRIPLKDVHTFNHLKGRSLWDWAKVVLNTAITDMKGCSVDVNVHVIGHYFDMYMLRYAYYQVLLLFI